MSVESLSYEDWQPPLYYAILVPFFLVSDGSLFMLRLVSVLIGAGVIAAAYGVAIAVWPKKLWTALTAVTFLAFLPQHVAILASVNNDSLAELWIAVILLLLLTLPQNPSLSRSVLLGIILGLGLLTKATVYIMAPVIAFALLWRYWRRWSQMLRVAAHIFVPALLIALPWWLRNTAIYGGLDVLGTAAHDAVVVGQTRTAEWVDTYGLDGTLGRMAETTFQSFWGQFGWMGVPMPGWVYRLLLLFSVVVGAGLVWLTIERRARPRTDREASRLPILVLGMTLLLTLVLYAGYNFTFVQHQGRYLFPGLIPIALGVAAGLGTWADPLIDRWPALALMLPFGLGLALVGLDLLALFHFILPSLS
jgi:4-amino-4-deoxy-L-arabinose transferase-like glycosyltransferase